MGFVQTLQNLLGPHQQLGHSLQCSRQKILLEGQTGPYNPFLGARYFKKGPMYKYLSNMQKRRNSWKVKEMKMAVSLKLTWGIPFLICTTEEIIFGNIKSKQYNQNVCNKNGK